LIEGGAGVGKSCFLHNICYKWATNRMFGDKFRYVFKVKLKKLLSTHQTLESEYGDRLVKLLSMSIIDQQDELKATFRKLSDSEIAIYT
jgi:hypothetical protein